MAASNALSTKPCVKRTVGVPALAMTSKYFPNKYDDYDSKAAKKYLNASLTGISDTFEETVKTYERASLDKLKTTHASEIFSSRCVFTGCAGIAYLYYSYAKKSSDNAIPLLLEATQYLQLKDSKRPHVTFLCGDAGPLALAAVISHRLADDRPKELRNPSTYVRRLEGLQSVADRVDTPDEILYGRAGYLYALLFVNRETNYNYIPADLITKVIKRMLDSGQILADELGTSSEAPLLYKWHNSFYLGGAHGTAGILYMLLQAKEYVTQEQLQSLIEPTLNWLLAQRFLKGNLPSSLGSNSDRLVQWCHGSPGFVQLCCLAYEVFGHQKYLDAGILCGEIVWERGLCTKGYSICHGVSGNGYTFLQLYQTTKNPKHLYRACCFANWCIDEHPETEKHSPDAPASMFEGLAGRLYYLADLLNPMEAKFPGFTL